MRLLPDTLNPDLNDQLKHLQHRVDGPELSSQQSDIKQFGATKDIC